MVSLLIALLITGVPHAPWPIDYVDAVEVNTVLGDNGEPRYSQVLWLHIGGPNEIVDWDFYNPGILPTCGISLYRDRGKVRAVHVVHRMPLYSDTYYDLEVRRRKSQPLFWRQRLMGRQD